MKTSDQVDQDTIEVLTAVVQLLHHATTRAWELADAAGPRSDLQLLGAGVHCAWCEAVALLPPGADVEESGRGASDPVQLLRRAEELTRTVPIAAAPPGMSGLVVTLCDLIREAS